LDGLQHPALVTSAHLSEWSAHARPGRRHNIQPPGIGNWLSDPHSQHHFPWLALPRFRARSGDRRRSACPPPRWGRLGARRLPQPDRL